MSNINGENKEKSLEKITKKEKYGNKFINIIKKKWLISGSKTLILVAMLVASFILITYGIQKLNLTPIDLTPNKAYTLSDESKERISKIEKDINVYLIGYSEDDSTTVLAKQYNNQNEKIKVEAVDITQRKDLAEKYGIDSNETNGIIVECGNKNKVLSANDLVNYNRNTYESTDLTESKITTAIMSVITEKIPKIYCLTKYSSISLTNGMSYLELFLQNEVMEVETLDILSKGKVPDDCDTLVITTPEKDFEDVVAEEIIKYINNGGRILWFNFAYGTEKKIPNVNKVLAMYGVEPFSVGYILETDANKMISGAPYMALTNAQAENVGSKASSVLTIQPTKVNVVETDKLVELKVDKEALLFTSKSSFFRSNLTIQSASKTAQDEDGDFLIGAKLTKTIKDDVQSTLIIYGDNYFVSDTPVLQNSSAPIISAYDNKDLVLNSVAYLAKREEGITVTKTKDNITTYNATEEETKIIQIIIFAVPAVILLAGIVVWQVRRRKR